MTLGHPADASVLDVVTSITPNTSLSCLEDVTAQLTVYFTPLLRAPAPTPSKPSSLARQFGKPSVQLLKQVFGCLSNKTPATVVPVLSSLAAIGLQSLSCLRSALRGRLFENEAQRFSLVKRLSSMQQPAETRRHALLLLHSISQHWPASSAGAPAKADCLDQLPALGHLDTAAAVPEQALILVGALLQLYACLSASDLVQLAGAWVSALTQATWTSLCWLRYHPFVAFV